MKVAELKALPPKLLIYSPAGRGKTALALTLGARAQYLDMDGNIDVAFGLDDNLRVERLKVDVKQFLDLDPQKATAFTQVDRYLLEVVNKCRKGTFEFDALVIDSLTALAAASQNQVMRAAGKPGENPLIQHWGLLLNEIERVIVKIRALPIPVIILAHETTFVSDDISQVQIAIPGQKLPGKLVRLFSEIWYMRIKSIGGGKSEIYIQTLPTASITCRSGRGLKNKTKVGTIQESHSDDSVCLWDILKEIGYIVKDSKNDVKKDRSSVKVEVS